MSAVGNCITMVLQYNVTKHNTCIIF